MIIQKAIHCAVNRVDLDAEQARQVMESLMSGQAAPAQIGAWLVALRMKGETVEEITGFATTMRDKVTRVQVDAPVVLDTCGTGGDGANTFNISTAAAFVAAGAGVKVAKHGNRAITSSSGGADVLKELGVNLDVSPEVVTRSIQEAGMGFLFAPHLHPAMKHVIGPRREIKLRTVFNILGPLTNPAGATHQLMGVFDAALAPVLAEVLGKLGVQKALVVSGPGGLDEAATWGKTTVAEWHRTSEQVKTWELDPVAYGIPQGALFDLTVSSPAESARIIQEILDNTKGPAHDIVRLNAALALLAAEKAPDLAACLVLADESLASGAALGVLARVREITSG